MDLSLGATAGWVGGPTAGLEVQEPLLQVKGQLWPVVVQHLLEELAVVLLGLGEVVQDL